MSVRVVERSYKDRFTNEATDWLLGNVGDWQKAIFTVDASVDFLGTSQTPLQIDMLNNVFVLPNGETWGGLGFSQGDTITFKYLLETDTDSDGNFNQKEQITQDLTIENISANKMRVDKGIENSEFTQMPLNFGKKRVSEVKIFVNTAPEGVRFEYTHLTNLNNKSTDLRSVIDNTVTEFIAPNLNNQGNGGWVTMKPNGKQSGMSIKNVRVRKLQSSDKPSFATGNIVNHTGLLTVRYYDGGEGGGFNTSKAFPITVIGTQQPYVVSCENAKHIPVNIDTGDINPTGLTVNRFISNVPEDVTHQISINVTFRITDLKKIQANVNRIKLVLYRYTGNDAMNFAESIVINEFPNVETLLGLELNYSGVITQNMLASESYCLGLEYKSDTYLSKTSLSYSVLSGLVELSSPNESFIAGSINRYQFEVNYMLSSFFETFKNIENRETPSYLLNSGSLTDNFRFKFMPKWNNPNILIENQLSDTVQKGNTGWFDENFNQQKNKFKVDSVKYLDLDGNSISSLDYTKKTIFRARISGISNIDLNSSRYGIGFAWIPQSQDDYINKETPFYQNLFVQSGDTNGGFQVNSSYSGPYFGAGINGASMNLENISISKGTNDVVIDGTFAPNSYFTELFKSKNVEDRNFALYVSVANTGLKRNYSDRVTLLCDYRGMTESVKDAGPYSFIEHSFLEHQEDKTSKGKERLNAVVQDDVLVRLPFRINKNNETTFSSMVLGVEMFNDSLDESFELESYSVDLSQSKKDSIGVQQFEVSQTRGFNLPIGNNKNIVEIEKGADTVDFSGFTAYYAFRVRWEEWQKNPNAPDVFFNSDLMNDGLNNDWFTYLQKSGWVINFFTKINAVNLGEELQYKNSWEFKVADYDSNTKISTTHNYFRDSDNTNINVGTDGATGRPLGVILSNERTRIEISFTILDSAVFSLSNTYAIITLEIDKGQGQFEVRELTTVWDSKSDNPLKGLDIESRLTRELSSDQKTITAKCIVDNALLNDGERYRVTGRIGCATDNGNFNDRLYEDKYENKYE